MDYRDKSIHKLLISITDSYKKASTNNSRYYQTGSTTIRFSDHYSEHEFIDFEIIKLSNGCYYFSDKDLRITSCFYKEDIVGFLKSYFSIRDLFESQIKGLLKSLKKTNEELKKVHKDLNSAKLRSDLELADSIYEENKSLKKQCKNIKVELNKLKGKLQSSNKALLKASNVIKDTINTIKI